MCTARSTSFVYGIALCLIPPSLLCFETPRHSRGLSTSTRLATRAREPPMVGSFTSIYRSEGSSPRQRTRATLCTRPARALRRKSNRSVARVTKSFHRGARTIRSNTGGSLWEIHCCTTAIWSPRSGPQLGRTVMNVWDVWTKSRWIFSTFLATTL